MLVYYYIGLDFCVNADKKGEIFINRAYRDIVTGAFLYEAANDVPVSYIKRTN